MGREESAISAADGTYQFTGLPAGSYTVITELAGNYIYPTGYNRHIEVNADRTNLDFNAIALDAGSGSTVSISAIQGAGHTSPMVGPVSNVIGIVTAVGESLFFMQSVDPDNDGATSEGLQVFLGRDDDNMIITPSVAVGDIISVSGTVAEFRGGENDITVTQIGPGATTTMLSSGNPLPMPAILGDSMTPSRVISDGALSGTFDPSTEGIDFYESVEGMRVQINDPQVVSGFLGFGEVSIVGNNGRYATILSPRGGVVLSEGDSNPEVISADTDFFDDALRLTEAKTGDTFNGPIVGIAHYSFGRPKVAVTAMPDLTPVTLARETTSLQGSSTRLSLANFNVENLGGDGSDEKFADIAETIVTGLSSPDIIALQEIQDDDGAADSGTVTAAVTYDRIVSEVETAGGPRYSWRQIDPIDKQDGGQPGGNIRVGFLYNPARVTFLDSGSPSATTAVDVSGTGATDISISPNPGRILGAGFDSSRKPIIGQFLFNGQRLFVINVHFKSKGGDDGLWGINQPHNRVTDVKRTQQAEHVKATVDEILAIDSNANIVVLGDLNDFAYSDPIGALTGSSLQNLTDNIAANDRYSLQFGGNSQQLDHILSSSAMATKLAEIDIVHRYSEYYDGDRDGNNGRHSDHDPVVATFNIPASSDDSTPPEWSSDPTLSGAAGEANFDFTFTANEDATLLYVVIPGTNSAPTVAQVLAGTNGSDDRAPAFGYAAAVATTSQTVSVESLALRPSTAYNVYAVLRDHAGNSSAAASIRTFAVTTATAVLPTVSAGPTVVGSPGRDQFDFTVTVDKSGTIYYAVYPRDTTAPASVAELMTATGATVSGSGPVVADTATTLTVTGIEAETDYDLYVGAVDQLDTASAAVSTVVMVTTAAAPLEAAPALFFSNYGEGGSNNKYLEIYNNTGAAVTLNAGGTNRFYILRLSNPDGTKTFQDDGILIDFPDDTMIAADAVYSIHHTSAVQAIMDKGDQADSNISFNGDDPMALVQELGGDNDSYDAGVDRIIDLIGVENANRVNFAQNTGLMRNADIVTGSATYDATQWTVYAQSAVDAGTEYGEPHTINSE